MLDKFYTKDDTARECISLVKDIKRYDLIVEPSAGSGVFSKKIKGCIAYDIEPDDKSIIKQDYLQLEKLDGNKILIIGNPPFGKRGLLAKAFIKKSIELGATTIAFILPDTFSKLSNQSESLFPAEWRLIVENKLSNNNFTIKEDEEIKDYHVPCSFYIWTKEIGSLNLRKEKVKDSTDFTFLKREDKKADFSINGNTGKVKAIKEITNPNSEHYIKANIDKDKLKRRFEKIKYDFKSSVNGGNAYIGRQEILQAYSEIYNKNIYYFPGTEIIKRAS